MTLDIRPMDPRTAPARLLADYHLMRAAVVAEDFPEDPPLTYESAVGRLRTPPVEDGTCHYWTCHLDGRLAGSARVALPEDSNSGIANIDVYVHPELRRRGIGTALLFPATAAVLEAGRGTILGVPMKPDSPGARWAHRLGFVVTRSTVMQVLIVAEAPRRLWDVRVPAGYRLTCWTGATPEPHVDSYAMARQAIHDAPLGATSYRETVWTPTLIRTTDRDLLDAGVEQRVVIAVEDGTDRIVGVHVLHNYPHRREFGYIHDTSVLVSHRGHGLGRAMKGAMMRWLADERPDLERVLTTTATANTFMIDINHSLGYHTARTMDWVETTTAQLTTQLTSSPRGAGG
ncbi:GNAT family N-acetyltransferase [Kitasatospora sp. NPDC057198]|uniref:GNAT family N-acetyltransferase n=1 Tax=Kitasatospora sp. NPDC057198 TaxID=3346046 RepID=UPI0036448A7C